MAVALSSRTQYAALCVTFSMKTAFYPTKINPSSFQLLLIPFIRYFFICGKTRRILDQLTTNPIDMKTLLLVKEIYYEGFRNLGNIIVRNYLKVFCWFSAILFAVVLYAFIFRVSTGFAFD